MKSYKSYTPCTEKNKFIKSMQQYNEFNKVMRQNRYYI